MAQNIGTALGKLVGEAIKQACNDTGKKPKQVGRVTMYAKANKKAMPQPAYTQHTKMANPFVSLMAMDELSTPKAKVRVVSKTVDPPISKKIPARGPIRGTKPMRPKLKVRVRQRPMRDEED